MDWRFYRITGRRKKLEEEEEGGEEQPTGPTGREDSERMGEERMGENGGEESQGLGLQEREEHQKKKEGKSFLPSSFCAQRAPRRGALGSSLNAQREREKEEKNGGGRSEEEEEEQRSAPEPLLVPFYSHGLGCGRMHVLKRAGGRRLEVVASVLLGFDAQGGFSKVPADGMVASIAAVHFEGHPLQ